MEIDQTDIDECNAIGWSGDWTKQLDKHLRPTDFLIRERMEATIGQIHEHADNHLSIMDIGCGIGIFALNIAKKYRKASVTGIDVSNRHIETAGELAELANLSDRVKFRVGDVKDALPEESFDYIICTEVLEHLLDPGAALANIYQACRPNAFLIVSVPHLYRSRKGQEGVFYRQVSDIDLSTVIHTQDTLLLDPNKKTYKYYHRLYSIEEISELVNTHGFEVISSQGVSIHMRYVKTAVGILSFSKLGAWLDKVLNRITHNRYAGNFILKCRRME